MLHQLHDRPVTNMNRRREERKRKTEREKGIGRNLNSIVRTIYVDIIECEEKSFH